jgi:hypothetical protein
MSNVGSDVLSITMPWGTGGKAPRIITLGTGLRSEIRYKLRQLYPKEGDTNNDIPETTSGLV